MKKPTRGGLDYKAKQVLAHLGSGQRPPGSRRHRVAHGRKTEAATLANQECSQASFEASGDRLIVTEIIDFVAQRSMGMALAHAPTMKRRQTSRPSLTALEEALILRQRVAHQSLPASLSKPRL